MLEHPPQGLQIALPNLMVSFSSISALTPSVKPLGLISTFAPIGMLDLV
jgi:hypothetical protein